MIGEATKAELQPLPNAKKILAPNISHVVDDVKGRYFLTSLIHVFGLTGPHPAKPVLTNFIRLVDKSAFEYEQARRTMKRYARRPSQRLERVGLLLRSADHLESCVNALYRAGRAAETLRRAQSVPPIAKGEVLTKAEMELLAALRNFAEHIDEKIVDEEVGPGRSSVMYYPRAGAIEYAGCSLSYAHLAGFIERLNTLADRLAEMRPERAAGDEEAEPTAARHETAFR